MNPPFSDFQIKLITDISKTSFYCIDDFLTNIDFQNVKRQSDDSCHPYFNSREDRAAHLVKNEQELLNKTAEYIALLDFLKRENLICISNKIYDNNNHIQIVKAVSNPAQPSKPHYDTFHKFYKLISSRFFHTVYPLPNLKIFINENKYFTDQQIFQFEEVKARKRAYRIALFTAIGSILITLIVNIIPLINSDKAKNIVIQEPVKISDTLNVTLNTIPTNNQELKVLDIDSLQTKK